MRLVVTENRKKCRGVRAMYRVEMLKRLMHMCHITLSFLAYYFCQKKAV